MLTVPSVDAAKLNLHIDWSALGARSPFGQLTY